jgi:GAF domain-containing protein
MTAGTPERLRLLYDLSRRLATFDRLDDVLRHATSGLRRLFDAEGAAVLIHDPARGELCFPIASQREGSEAEERELADVRFPADQGIAGWVLANGQAVIVPDVANDPRFYRGVDKATGATTQMLLAAPLRTEGPCIGVVEIMNPAAGHIGNEDLEFLDAVASDIAVAYAKAELHDRMREEAATLRRLTRLVGIALIVLGLLLAGWAVFAALARALPLGSVLASPAVLAGAVAVAAGVVVLRVVRGAVPR